MNTINLQTISLIPLKSSYPPPILSSNKEDKSAYPRGKIVTELRKRTILIGPTGGGIGKTTLATALAYEAVRFGFKVLLVDCTGGGSFTSATRRYADPKSEMSLAKAIQEGLPAPVYPVESWAPNERRSWQKGGPLVPGGELYISPSFQTDDEPSIAEVLAKPGSVAESRLARALSRAATDIDLVFLDMPGSCTDAQLSAALYASEHVLLPVAPRPYWGKGLGDLHWRVCQWWEATEFFINFLGVVPTMIRPREDTEFLRGLGSQLSSKLDIDGKVFAPGIEYRRAFSAAQADGGPVTDRASTLQGRRDLRSVPAALAKTTLSILEEIDRDHELTDGVPLLGLDTVRQQLHAQEVPEQWQEILTGPSLFELPTHV